MVAECRAFRDLAKEVMNSELEGVQFGQKGMGKCMRKVKKSCSNAKMHFPRQEQHVISLEKAKMRLVVSFRCLCCLDHTTSQSEESNQFILKITRQRRILHRKL